MEFARNLEAFVNASIVDIAKIWFLYLSNKDHPLILGYQLLCHRSES